MRNKKAILSIFLTAVVLSIVSYVYLDRIPVRLFILKPQANQVAAFQINVYLNRRLSTVTSLSLSRPQLSEAFKILSAKNIYQLQSLASNFGQFDFVIGASQPNDDMDSFWNDFLSPQRSTDSFDNLASLDKLYFSFSAERKLTIQDSGKATNQIGTSPQLAFTPTAIPQVKKVISKPIVHVEILNGCGIKGAADRVVIRIKSETIEAKNGGNAVNFNYFNSQLLLSAVDFPDLEKSLKALGFSKLSQIRSNTLPVGYDAVFIVGKDFRLIKGN
jgi:hypothetical protein